MGVERKNALIRRQLEISEDIYLRLTAWIEAHGGITFSPAKVSKAIGADIGVCRRFLAIHPLVSTIDDEMFNKPGPQQRYISLAEPLTPTIAGVIEEAEIHMKQFDKGRDAREEFYRSVEERSLCLPRKSRLRKVY
jgi:hypothetical protein